MKISFHGSRGLKDERVRIIILEMLEKYNPEVIVTHAEPDGVCAMARLIAKEKGIPLKLHFLNFKYLRGAFEHRSKDVLKDSDVAIFIHDGISVGTSNEIKLGEKMKMKFEKHDVKPTKHKQSVGFELDALELSDLLNVDDVN